MERLLLRSKRMEIKYFKVCRVRCKLCDDVLEHINTSKEDNHNNVLWCSCKKTMLDPSATFYRVIGNPEEYEDLSEPWEL